jgi:hypothetical protein
LRSDPALQKVARKSRNGFTTDYADNTDILERGTAAVLFPAGKTRKTRTIPEGSDTNFHELTQAF